MNCSMLGFPVLHYLPEFTQTHVDWVSDAIQLSHSLSLLSLLALNLSLHQGLFQWVGSSHQVAKDWSFNISPSNEHPGLLSFSMDWWDRLAGQGTLKSILQHHCSKASILLHLSFFIVQISHAYMTTGKTIGLHIQSLVGKVMSLLFNMLSRFVIAFCPKRKHLFMDKLCLFQMKQDKS